MENNGYIFDVIIPRIEANKEFIEFSELSVEIAFHRLSMNLTASSINVSEFQHNSGIEFESMLEELKYMISSIPVLLIVKYKGEVVGVCDIMWPQTILSKINSTMDEICHIGQSDLNLDGINVGVIEFVMRIRKKCTEPEHLWSSLELNSNLKSLIDKDDVFFTIDGDSNKPIQDARICEIAKLMKMLTSIEKKDDHPCLKEITELCECTRKSLQGASSSTDDTNSSISSGSNEDKKESKKDTCWLCLKDNLPLPPQLTETILRVPNFCGLCKTNMTWLPKFSACPNCGFKSIPQLQDKVYDENEKAENVIQEYANVELNCSEEGKEQPCSTTEKGKRLKNRCVCNGRNTCAFCRVQKLAMETLTETAGKTNEKGVYDCEKCEKEESRSFKILKTDTSCRPFLERVLSEVCVLYDVKGVAMPKRKKLTESCARDLKAAWHNNQSKSKTKEEKAKATSHENERTHPEKQHAVYSKLTEGRQLQNQIPINKKQANKCGARICRKEKSNKRCINGGQCGANVPAHMGWLWTAGSKRGRKPGTIDKRIKRIMHFFLNIRPTTTPEARRIIFAHIQKLNAQLKPIPPTLHVAKKHDGYFVTLNPEAHPDSERQCLHPCKEVKPLTFKIIKDPKRVLFSNLKQKLKNMGFSKCVCHKPLTECICRNYEEKIRLEYELVRECYKRQVPLCQNELVLSDTTDSEADLSFNFTPPTAVAKSDRDKTPFKVNQSTQCTKDDLNLSFAMRRSFNRYLASYDCAIDDKYGKLRYLPQPGEEDVVAKWLDSVRAAKKAARSKMAAEKAAKELQAARQKIAEQSNAQAAAKKANQPTDMPFGPEGPPAVARDGTALGADGKPLLDSEGNAYQVERGPDGSLKAKPKKKGLDMIKYLIGKGLIVKKEKGRKAPKLPPGGINPEYLAMERALRRKWYLQLFEQPLPLVCKVDRRGKPYGNCYNSGWDRIC